MENYYSALSAFSLNMGHPQPIKIVIVIEIITNYSNDWESTVVSLYFGQI